MRDFKLIVIEDAGVDIDIIDGEAAYVDFESQTNDQRAAVACYMCKGTLPGALEQGISWGSDYSTENTAMLLNNELQQALQNAAGSSSSGTASTAVSNYAAQLIIKDGASGVIITRS